MRWRGRRASSVVVVASLLLSMVLSTSAAAGSEENSGAWSTGDVVDVVAPTGSVRFGVYVEPDLLPEIVDSLDRYVADLRIEGFDPFVEAFGGTAEELRSVLQDEHDAGLVGALLVGDLPVYWFTSSATPWDNDTYPHDLYFMDLDGTYADDTPVDVHVDGSGDVEPEIYVARLTPSTVTGLTGRSEIELITDYFDRNHAYRTGAMPYRARAAVFSDGIGDETVAEDALSQVYAELDVVRELDSTPANFLDLVARDNETMFSAVHAGPTSMSFYVGPGYEGYEGTLTSAEVLAAGPQAAFFALFNCSAGLYTRSDNLLGMYVLGTDRGLHGLGSTKTWNFYRMGDYYAPLGAGRSVGEAAVAYLELYTGSTEPLELAFIRYLYGITMHGDPTLVPLTMGDGPASIVGSVQHDLDGDGVAEPGEPGVAGWTVFADQDGDGAADSWEPTTTTGSDGTYELTGLAPSRYSIELVDRAGWSRTWASGPTSAVVVSGERADGPSIGVLGLPGAPADLVATADPGTVSVTWAPPREANDDSITGYEIGIEPIGIRRAVTGTSATFSGLQNGIAQTASVQAVNASGSGPVATADPVTPVAPQAVQRVGYLMLRTDGVVHGFGDADARDAVTSPDASAKIAISADGIGYWVLDTGGRVHVFGVPHLGDLTGADRSDWLAGERPAALSVTPDEQGYWIFTDRGRAVSFGSASDHGDLVELGLAPVLNGPVVDSVATPDGSGYYMVASDGGVFAFGSAAFRGSMGGTPLNEPVVGLLPDLDGSGYWLVAADGGVFAFDADFRGSVPGALPTGVRLNAPVVGGLSYGDGYLMVASDGGIFSFSDLPFLGSLGADPPPAPVTDVAAFVDG